MVTDKFKNLRYKLLENNNWPLRYMFKFIAPNEDGKVKQVTDLLPSNCDVSFKHTKSLRHVSITCIAYMNSADDIIDVLDKVDKIEGVLSL